MKPVFYSPDALRSLARHGNVAKRVRKAVLEYAAGTGAHANNVTRLVGSPLSRLRVGDFRFIFHETDTEVAVTLIRPRGSAYD